MPRPHLVQWQFLRDGGKQFLHVLRGLGRSLKEEEAGFLRVCLSISRLDCPLVGLLGHQVQLVPSESDDDVLVCLPLQLLDPRLGLVE
jgi:hypothetical protein